MGAEVEFFGNRVRVSIISGDVKSRGGVEGRIGVRQWNLKVRLREFSRLWRGGGMFSEPAYSALVTHAYLNS